MHDANGISTPVARLWDKHAALQMGLLQPGTASITYVDEVLSLVTSATLYKNKSSSA